MNGFAHPWLLLLAALAPALTWLRYRRRARPTLRFSDGTALAALPASWAVRARPLLPLLHGGALILLAVALAGPRRGLRESLVRAEAVDIVLLVDVSTSMLAEDFSTPGQRRNRLDAAREVAQRFVARRDQDRIALVAFAAMPYSVAPLTLDRDWLRLQIDRLQTGVIEDGTAIGDGLASAVNRLRESAARSKVVILLTDGENNAGTLSPLNAAEAARAVGARVYTVGAGRDGPVEIPVRDPQGRTFYRRVWSQIDEATLQEMARVTGGRYFRATDAKGLDQAFAEIDRMEKTEVEVRHYTQYEQRFAPFVAAALVLLGVERLLALTRLGGLP